ncbi:helix-turn-helix domain-containing protein [Lederbergia sp. NSJ-179]|nr:helix-turn-helix domain-containing protein [Lederbergia sp. NSJ-179]MCJ7843176.1 helix-turn-helix domain-containing protein [Lederbergia sp. NSJ-179]
MSESTLLPYLVILMAAMGDTEAMGRVLEHYTGMCILFAEDLFII